MEKPAGKKNGERKDDGVVDRLLWKSRTDEKTGLRNEKGFILEAQSELSLAHRQNLPVVYLLFDLIGLHQLNDDFGQEVGDMAIQSAAKAIRDTFYRRTDDIVGRSHAHGDEFEAFFVIGKESADSSKQRRILRKGADFRELMRFLEIQLTDVQWQMNNLWEEAFSTVFGVKPVRGLEIRMGKSYFDPSVDQARPYPSLDELRKWADEDLRLLKKAEKSKVRV